MQIVLEMRSAREKDIVLKEIKKFIFAALLIQKGDMNQICVRRSILDRSRALKASFTSSTASSSSSVSSSSSATLGTLGAYEPGKGRDFSSAAEMLDFDDGDEDEYGAEEESLSSSSSSSSSSSALGLNEDEFDEGH